MPPKRRVGLKRMDAAIDALTPMGFSPEIIRRKVKALLKEYGNEGWVFIEEAAYKLLIECILEDQEQCEQGEPSSNDEGCLLTLKDSQNEVRDQGGEEAKPSEGVPLIEASEPTCSNLDTTLTTPATDASLENPLAVLKPTSSPPENVPSPSKIATSNEVTLTNGKLIDQEKMASLSEAYTFSGPPGFEHLSRLQLEYASTKRKPCLGWMDPKDDQTFVLLEPAPVLGWKARQRPRKRKSRWDVGPNDVVQ